MMTNVSEVGRPMVRVSKINRINAINERLKHVWVDASFEDESMWAHILGHMPEVALYEQAKRKLKAPAWLSDSDWPACGYVEPLLSKEQERHLFRQFNFLKWRAKTIANKSKVTHAELDEVDDILIRADQVAGQLVLCNVRIAIKFIKKNYDNNRYMFDLLSESFIVIQRSINNFNWTMGFAFSTYLMRSMFNSIGCVSQQIQKQQALQIYDNTSGGSADLGFLPDPRSHVEFDRLTARNVISSFLDSDDPLDERERRILRSRFFDERKLDDIGREHGVSKERIRQIIQECYAKIHQWLGDEVVELYQEAFA